jgi:uncharacterized protein YbjT (DUF2867 family)
VIIMILVTAATGTVGSRVVGELRDRGAQVCAAIHTTPLRIDGVPARPIDFDRPQTLPPALDDVHTVFLASYETLHEQSLVDAARHAGVERIVKLSAWRAAEEGFLVGTWHRQVERAIEASGIRWTFLRPNSFMHNIVTVMGDDIRSEDAFYDSVDDASINHVDVRDIARVAARVLTEPGHDHQVYSLSGPAAVTHEEIAEALTSALGRRIRYRRVSDEEYRKRWLARGVSQEEADAWVDLNRYYRTGGSSGVTSTVRELTGRAPTPVSQFCRDHASLLAAGQ